ncbi:hypothetical protein WKW75_37360 [Bradyrhizobium ottawaense]
MSTVDLNALATDQYLNAKQVRERYGSVSNVSAYFTAQATRAAGRGVA